MVVDHSNRLMIRAVLQTSSQLIFWYDNQVSSSHMVTW